MLARVSCSDGKNLRGLLPHPVQRIVPGSVNHFGGTQFGSTIEAKLAERHQWLQHLGLNASCAYDLAMHTLEHPDFNLSEFQQHWRQLCLEMGPKRQVEVDTMVLRSIRELLQTRSTRMNDRRTPSPPRGINWNLSGIDNPTTYYPIDHHSERRMTSTPVQELKKNAVEVDFYDINNDPRNFHKNNEAQKPNDFISISHNHQNGTQVAYADCRNVYPGNRQFTGYNNQHFNKNFGNAPNFNNNYHTKLPTLSEETNNFHSNMEARGLQQQGRSFYSTTLQFQNGIRDSNEFYANNVDMDNWNLNENQHQNGFQSERNRIRNNSPNGFDQQRNHRKRILDSSRNRDLPKRRILEPNNLFRIGNFEMPRMQGRTGDLPQPESISYAIMFFKRTYCPIVGGEEFARSPRPALTGVCIPTNRNRTAAKRIRQELRKGWATLYRLENYRNWDIWWKDFKWCEARIAKELERFKGVDLMATSFLHVPMNYNTPNGVLKLQKHIRMALESNKTNYQSIIGTIFELMNVKFLEKLTDQDICQLQDLIRYMPNHLWIYKMRSMVYLWSRYYGVRTFTDARSEEGSKQIWATSTQWHSPLFHWLAQQAFIELKQISRIEWPEHDRLYPTINLY